MVELRVSGGSSCQVRPPPRAGSSRVDTARNALTPLQVAAHRPLGEPARAHQTRRACTCSCWPLVRNNSSGQDEGLTAAHSSTWHVFTRCQQATLQTSTLVTPHPAAGAAYRKSTGNTEIPGMQSSVQMMPVLIFPLSNICSLTVNHVRPPGDRIIRWHLLKSCPSL